MNQPNLTTEQRFREALAYELRAERDLELARAKSLEEALKDAPAEALAAARAERSPRVQRARTRLIDARVDREVAQLALEGGAR